LILCSNLSGLLFVIRGGLDMRKLTIIAIALFCFNFIAAGNAAENEDRSYYTLATEVKDAVVRQDINVLLKYVSPSGTYFMDTVYTYKEINEIIGKKDSWLYKHLFAGESSIKTYFKKAKRLKIKITHRNDNAIFVSYQSSNYEPNKWVECCFIRTNGKWYFDGIFYCK
jgi:hypothetical protein